MHSAIIYVKNDNYEKYGNICVNSSLIQSFVRGEIGKVEVRIKEYDEKLAEFYGYGLNKLMANALLGDARQNEEGETYYLTKLPDFKGQTDG